MRFASTLRGKLKVSGTGEATLDVGVIGLSCIDCIACGESRHWGIQNPVGDVLMRPGGVGNAISAISGLGLKISVSTRIGDDLLGGYLLEQWRNLGVDTCGVVLDQQASTGFAFVLDHGGERTPFYSPGANANFSLSDIPQAFRQRLRCLLVFFVGDLPSLDGQPMRQLLQECAANGVVAMLDVTDRVGADYTSISSYLPHASLVVSAEEGRRMTGERTPAGILAGLHSLSERRSHLLAVTWSDGAAALVRRGTGYQYLEVPSPFRGRPVRNVVGAGDAFRAGLGAYITRHHQSYWAGNLDYREALLTASVVSYCYLSRPADAPPCSLHEAEELLQSAKRA